MLRLLPSTAGARRDRLWWAFMAPHLVLVVWWPFSIFVALASLGAISPWATSYLFYTALPYGLFVVAAAYLHELFAERGTLLRVLALSVPFASGTWLTLPMLFLILFSG